MCGIVGYAGRSGGADLLHRMTDVMVHRGPDDVGFHHGGDVGFGFRRLSIIDVAGGHQPIYNEDGTVALVFNGEVYNFRAVRRDLIARGHVFSTRSDSETIVHLYEEYGEACVDHIRGMFAFAIHDMRKKLVFVARDRLGVKPVYYWSDGRTLLFASEMKSILQSDRVSRDPDLESVDTYMGLRYVPGPRTLIRGVFKLPAGCVLRWRDGQAEVNRYWSINTVSPREMEVADYQEEFNRLFVEAVRYRLMSDVPFGAYLSGGLDSTAIVAAMSELTSRPVRTFSVGFGWVGDEVEDAGEVAGRLGADHHAITCEGDDFRFLPDIIWHLDEPVGDAIIVPMFLLSKLAREHVKVVLSGEGADEILAGYFPHKVMNWADRYRRMVPSSVRGMVPSLVRAVPPAVLNLAFDYPGRLGSRGQEKLLTYLKLLESRNPEAEYLHLISLFEEIDKARLYAGDLRDSISAFGPPLPVSRHGPQEDYLNRVLDLQYEHWLPDDILMKQDKMSMANSVEARVPFLDHRLVEFLRTVPSSFKLRGGATKHLLRGYLRTTPVTAVAERRKKAFYIPVDRYLGKGPLAEITAECLSEESVRRRGYFEWPEVKRIRNAVGDHDFLYGKQIFSMVALELWHRIFIDGESGWTSATSRP